MKEKNSSQLELKYVDQRYDGLEAWIRKGQSGWARLDFILEYYVSGNVDLSRRYKGQLGDEEKAKQYYDLLLTKLEQLTSDGLDFEIQKYLDWQKNNLSKINEVRNLLHPA